MESRDELFDDANGDLAVGELENAVERMVLLSRGNELTAADLPDFLHPSPLESNGTSFALSEQSMSLEAMEKQMILQALKRYGLIVADNGSPWYITGAPSPGWNEDSLNTLKQVPGSAFEAVETGAIIH